MINIFNELKITSPYILMDYMNHIDSGFMDRNKLCHYSMDNTFAHTYMLQSPKEVLQNKVGICWDQVEFERIYFRNNDYNYETYFMVYYADNFSPNHTFLIYEYKGMWCWFENYWEDYKGIHCYKSKERLLKDVKAKFVKSLQYNLDINSDLVCTFKYSMPIYGTSSPDFYKHCESSTRILI